MRVKIVLLLILGLIGNGYIMADDNQGNTEPKELALARTAYQNQAKVVLDPVKQKYLATLDALKKQLGSKGDATGAMSVQKEIDSLKTESSDSKVADHSLKIIKATYGTKTNSVNVTKCLNSLIKNNKLNTKVSLSLTEGKDPAFGVVKNLIVIYSYDGTKKEATYIEGDTVSLPDE